MKRRQETIERGYPHSTGGIFDHLLKKRKSSEDLSENDEEEDEIEDMGLFGENLNSFKKQ